MAAEQWQRAEIPGPTRAVAVSKPEKIPPCKNECPIGNDIHEFLHLSKQGRFEEAIEVLKETNPLPAICGRVCHHPCEDTCNRKKYDEPVGIRNVERFLGDLSLKRPIEKRTNSSLLPKVAIVGSGPSGISCAYHLARKGYRVTIFEALPTIGGTPAIGIPAFRLPKDILQRGVDFLKAQGVEIKTNHPIKSLDELREYDAIFLGTGAMESIKLGIPNEEAKGVFLGLDFLKAVNLGEKIEVGKKVVVIGGGNTAMDCARVAIRMGSLVTVLYRRSREEMPAISEEVEEALREGVEIKFLVAPKSILAENNRVVGVECIKMYLGAPDASGRRRPIPIEGSEFKMEADTVIAAIGQRSDLSYLPKDIKLERGFIKVDEFGRTSRPNVFAGGDAAGVVQRVSNAVGSGRHVASSIDAYLRGESPKILKKPPVVESWEINMDHFTLEPKVQMPYLDLPERKEGFREISLGYDERMTKTEANRCFHCGFGIGVEDLSLIVSLITEARHPIFIVGHEATEIDFGGGEKPIDYVIRIAKAAKIPVVATAQTVAEFLKRDFKPTAWMSSVDIGARLTDPEWSVSGKRGSHDLALIIGIPYFMEWLIESGLKSFAPNLKMVSLNRHYHPHCNWSFPNLSLKDWQNNLKVIARRMEEREK